MSTSSEPIDRLRRSLRTLAETMRVEGLATLHVMRVPRPYFCTHCDGVTYRPVQSGREVRCRDCDREIGGEG